MNYCVVRLPGGLGNQLFALYAARYISQETNLQTYLDFDGIDYTHHDQKIDISNFILSPQETFLSDETTFLSRASRIKFAQQLRVTLQKKTPYLAGRISYFALDIGDDFRSSLDVILAHLKHKIVKFPLSFEGYFADFSYFDLVRCESLKSLRLKFESRQFLELSKETDNSRILGVHLRLGDFLRHPYTIGCLSDEFFIGAIEQAFATRKYDQVWVFTDSLEFAYQRIHSWPFRNKIEIIGMTHHTNACEELLLLSKCAGIICSNSTFSFWGAKFASSQNPGVQVLYPESFRRDKRTSIGSIPNSWNSMKPIWSD